MVIRFGTDGWRGIIAHDFTFENVAKCTQGVADYIKEVGFAHLGLLVAYDTRFSSKEFATLVADILANNGIRTLLCDKVTPTPAASYNILVQETAGAVVITASHNPAQWNGFKMKAKYGGSASSEILEKVEGHIELAGKRRGDLPSNANSGELVLAIDASAPYMEQLERLVDLETINSSGLDLVIDVMHGAGSGYLPNLLRGAQGQILEIRGEVNPAFPGMAQPEPVCQNLTQLSKVVPQEGADLGIAYDGDADRLGLVDEKGCYINTQDAFALLALYLLEVKGERGPLVKSITSSDMIFRLGDLYNVPVFETGIGFKYAGQAMMREDALMAGEESGGYAFKGHIPERDGILSSLYMVEFMAKTHMTASELVQYLHSKVGEHHYRRRDITFPHKDRARLTQLLDRGLEVKDVAGFNVLSRDSKEGLRLRFEQGWLALRFSGTEPLLRVYAEGPTPETVRMLLDGAGEFLGLDAGHFDEA